MEKETQKIDETKNETTVLKIKISLVNSKVYEAFIPFDEPNITIEMVANKVLGEKSTQVINLFDIDSTPVSIMKDKICSIEVVTSKNEEQKDKME